MKIVMVQTFHYYRGGDSTYMLNLTRLLEEQGHEVIPFAMEHPLNLPSPYSKYFVSEIDFPALLAEFSPRAACTVIGRSIHNREARRKMEALLDDVKPDLAHFHNIHGHLTTSILSPLTRRGVPVVWTLHDFGLVCPNASFLSGDEICERCLPDRFYHVLLRRCKKGSLAASFMAMLTTYHDRMIRLPDRVDRFIAPSNFLRSKMIEGGFPSGRITWIPNFVNLDAYRPKDGTDYFLYFGRLLYEKGLDVLIEAVSKLDTGRLVIMGEGPREQELKALASEKAPDRVEFIGYRGGDELMRVLDGAQFVVLPSRWYENLPFTIMEAFAAGKAVVASRVGGIPEMVEDGVNGCLFPVGDGEALAGCLRKMLADPGMRAEMGRRGRAKAEKLYNRAEHYRRIIEVYRDVTGSDV